MRAIHLLLVIFMALLFAGSSTYASSDTPLIQAVLDHDLDSQKHLGDSDSSSSDLNTILPYRYTPHTIARFGQSVKIAASGNKPPRRLVSYPGLSQAPPVVFKN